MLGRLLGGLGAILIRPAAGIDVLECLLWVSFPWLDELGVSAVSVGGRAEVLGQKVQPWVP